ncbi:LamG-like jellyroll fold domain-containing protein [Flavobacterium sp. WC2509]|uniref:LamG-like jellyroll fold domain-containing protein n=1 Tax=Flavobacterium sp. WC2509 TaxID=3461406 RepID=UPI004044A81E
MAKNSISITFLFILLSFVLNGQNLKQTDVKTEWILANILREKSNSIEISGNPQLVSSPYGEAVSFDGVDDAIILNEMPLKSLQGFTVEMIFMPETNAPFEQRVLHIGESKADRMLLEIRAVDSNWYFDGYACSGLNKKALINEKLIHPLGEWYHVAFVVTPKSLTTYVNGKKELTEEFSFLPIETGQTSFGVRLNKVSWFKGTIYKIRISPNQTNPKDFMILK